MPRWLQLPRIHRYFENMKPTHNDLAAGMIAIGAEACFLDDIPQAVFKRLVELGMARMKADEWVLTATGKKILEASPKVMRIFRG